MKTLIIYDNTGMIWNINYGQYVLPEGLTAMITDVPEGAQVQNIDVSNETPQIVFASLPENEINRMKSEMNSLREENSMMNIALTFVADTFTDEQALTLPTLYPYWNINVSYKKDKRVRYGEVLYKVLQDHTSQEDWTPENSPSLFAKVLIEDANVVTEWVQPDSTNGYSIGNKVAYNGVTYESLVDNNVWQPGAVGTESVWKVIV